MSSSGKYRKLTDIDHCLIRPDMWIGSTAIQDLEVYLPDASSRYTLQEAPVNPGFLKLFDEILSNSADEHKRSPKLNKIVVTVDTTQGRVTIYDNGGIPVEMHEEYGTWIPELIFSELKAGSNFDDTEDRLVAGTNGVGSTLTNIFSTMFKVRTCDGKSLFEQTFSNNMKSRTQPQVTTSRAAGFTEITYHPDLTRFSMSTIDETHLELMRKRCIDVAGSNPKLTVVFNGQEFKFPKFLPYCRLYVDDVILEESDNWSVGISASNGSFQQVSFVNGVETRDGGTHVDYIASQIVEYLREKVKKKHKIDLRPGEIRNHLMLFVKANIVNPRFSSQTKEKLIIESKSFGTSHTVSDRTLKLLMESELVKRILDWAEQKSLAEERKGLRELGKKLSKSRVAKLIDAKSRSDRKSCTLALFEGDSASSAFRKYRDPNFQGAFPLRGKFINVSEHPTSKVIQNQEVQDLLAAIGLRLDEPALDLRYGRILIYSDADPDGDSIAGLLVNFFAKFWPEMLDAGQVCRVMTPLVVAKKSSDKKWFYTATEFLEWTKTTDTSKWSIEYKKGLAALEDDEYREIIRAPKVFSLLLGDTGRKALEAWFGDDVTPRKEKILGAEIDREEV